MGNGTHEQRLLSLEHHVHGRGWWLRLVAWIGFGIIVALAFGIQNRNIEVDASTRHEACVAILHNLDGIIAVAKVEAGEAEHVESERGSAAHERLNVVIGTLRTSRRNLLESALCDGVQA